MNALDTNTIASSIKQRLDVFDKQGVAVLCEELTRFLYEHNDTFPSSDAEKILQHLRNKRMFSQMQKVADAFIQTQRATFTIQRQYAQSLIDQANYTAAIAVLNNLVNDTAVNGGRDPKAATENMEAKGLIGRTYKQLYVASAKGESKAMFMKQAIRAYASVYQASPVMHLWHGINLVALVQRAKRDKLSDSEWPDGQQLAESIRSNIQSKYDEQTATAWDFATACEACVALNRPEEALQWLSGCLRMPYVDAFEIASLLRQMEEIWRLNMDSAMGRLLLPLLRAALLEREGGSFIIDTAAIKQQQQLQQQISSVYENMQETGRKLVEKKAGSSMTLEKVFGEDSFKTYQWYITGAEHCRMIARIGRETSKGFGTGFLIRGTDLHEQLGDELLLMTNAHVVSEDPTDRALHPDEAIVSFEVLDNAGNQYRISEIVWSSPSTALDVSVLRFDGTSLATLKELTRDVTFYPLANRLPPLGNDGDHTERVYIIGHPAGGTLQLSFQDNVLLDYEDPRIHYRTPTTGGSSGSPVFNQQWQLLGLHHGGSSEMPKLHGKEGTYQANEGMWIEAIKKAFRYKS